MTPFDYCLINFFPFTKYYEILKQYSDIFGKENIIIRPFEKLQLPNGPVYDFYASVLNFTEKEISMLETSYSVNQSLSRDSIEFIASSGIYEGNLFSHIEAMLNYNSKGNVYFSNEERKRFLAFHEEGNTSLAREYLGREDGKLFYEEVKEYEPYPGLSLEKAIEIRDKLIDLCELKGGNGYLNSHHRYTIKRSGETALNEVLDSARKIYYGNANERQALTLINSFFKTYTGENRPIIIYGRYGELAELILGKAITYSKSINIFISDQRLYTEEYYPMQAVRYEHIKDLNPSAIIIAATASGESIRTALGKLALEDTVIYPAYDFSDEAWYEFTAPLTTPDGYVNPYWEERLDD